MIVPIIAVAILMGVLPNLFLRPIEPSVERMLNQVPASGAPSRIQARAAPSPSPSASSESAMTPSLNAIVPMACVDGGRHRRDGRRGVPRSGRADADRRRSASIGLVGAAFATVLLWNHNASSFGVVAADNFGLFVTGIADRRRPAVAGDFGADHRARAAAAAASTTR